MQAGLLSKTEKANGESKSAFLHHGQGDPPGGGGLLGASVVHTPTGHLFYGLAVSRLLLFPAWV